MTDVRAPGRLPDEAVSFILRLGKALHTYGLAADALEEALSGVTRRLGLDAQFFTTPTAIFAAFGAPEEQSTHLIRVVPSEPNLGKLAALDAVTRAIHAGTITPREGIERVDAIIAARDPYDGAIAILSCGIASAAVCRVLSGGMAEVAVAGLAGLLVGMVERATRRLPHSSYVYELFGSMTVAVFVSLLAAFGLSVSVSTATLAGVIILLPGLTLTVAMTELASRHLAAGTARLSGAFITFIAMAFGVAVGNRVAAALVGVAPAVAPEPLLEWTRWAGVAVAPLAFGIYLRARPRDLGWIWTAGIVGYVAVRLGADGLGPALGASIGSLTVGILANLFERRRHGPAAVALVPGVLLLVPGSIGYRSVASLLDENVVDGVSTGFSMIFTAMALAAGLLMANVLVPPQRHAK